MYYKNKTRTASYKINRILLFIVLLLLTITIIVGITKYHKLKSDNPAELISFMLNSPKEVNVNKTIGVEPSSKQLDILNNPKNYKAEDKDCDLLLKQWYTFSLADRAYYKYRMENFIHQVYKLNITLPLTQHTNIPKLSDLKVSKSTTVNTDYINKLGVIYNCVWSISSLVEGKILREENTPDTYLVDVLKKYQTTLNNNYLQLSNLNIENKILQMDVNFNLKYLAFANKALIENLVNNKKDKIVENYHSILKTSENLDLLLSNH